MPKPTILVIILAAAVITVGGYFLFAQGNEEDTNNATNTVVMTNENVNMANVNSLGNLNTNIDTSDWQTYTNEKYEYSVKYPSDSTYRELSNGGASNPDDLSVMVDFTLGDLGIRVSAYQNSVNAVTLGELIDAKLAGGSVTDYEQVLANGKTGWEKYTFLPTDSGVQRMGAGITLIGKDYFYLITTGNQFTPEFTQNREELYHAFANTFKLL